jgi:hypothetical protein
MRTHIEQAHYFVPVLGIAWISTATPLNDKNTGIMRMKRTQTPLVGEAFVWVGRITAIGLTMVLPGIVGSWLDYRLGTAFCEPAGFVLGFFAGLASLIRVATARRQKNM